MSIAIFNDQDVLAGQRLGISTGKAISLGVMAFGLGCMNIYHMGNAVTSKLLTPESSVLLFILLYFIAACIAFIEVPITEEITTQTARSGGSAKGHKLMLAVVACMAVGGGVYSITTDAEKVDATRTAYTTEESSFEDLKHGLISIRNAARANATTTAERSQANADYYQALAALKRKQAQHQNTRPPEAVVTGSFWHWLWAIGFSLLCSLGVIIITNYLTKYHKPLTEIPRVFFKVREDQAWAMNDDDVRVIPAHVDLTGSSSTRAARKAIIAPSSDSGSSDLTSTKSGTTENRPHVVDLGSGRKIDTGERLPNEESQKEGMTAYSDNHYGAIKQAILNQEFKPTQAPVKTKLVSLKVRFVDDGARQQKAVEILDQLKRESVLLDNPSFGKGGQIVAKYILNPDYLASEEESATSLGDEIGEYDLVTVCPHCRTVNATDAIDIEKRKGTVKCEQCNKGHVATSHQYDKSQSYPDLLARAWGT